MSRVGTTSHTPRMAAPPCYTSPLGILSDVARNLCGPHVLSSCGCQSRREGGHDFISDLYPPQPPGGSCPAVSDPRPQGRPVVVGTPPPHRVPRNHGHMVSLGMPLFPWRPQ